MGTVNPPISRIQRRFFDLDDKMLADFDRLSLWRAFGASASCDWDELLKSPRVLLISEAGSGKTHECKAEQKRLWNAGEAAFYLELAGLAKSNIEDQLSPEQSTRLEAWRTAQSERATFFLDSFDELQLTRGSFPIALNRLTKAIGGQLHRVRVVVTARPIAFDQNLIRERLPVPLQPEPAASPEAFADLAMGRRRDAAATTESKPPPDWRTVALMPLDEAQMRHFAQGQGVADADAMLAAIRHDNAEDFAHRPQDLIELCAGWRDHGRIGSHREQVESNISVKLKPRTDRRERTALAPDKAREGAARLALAALLTRKLTLRHSVEADQDGEPGTALDPETILSDWNEDERRTLLERALFSFASYGRVRFHHRSTIELLAAERLHTLRRRGMSIRAIQRLLFADLAYGPRVVKPTMRPVAAWLVLRDGMDSIFDEVLAREPEVLLDHGDPRSLSKERRMRVLRAYVERYGNGSWRGQHIPSLQVRRFAAPELSDEVLRLWATGIENAEVRELLLDIAAAAPIPAMADIAHRVLFDETAALGERLSALDVLVRMDDARLDAFTQALADEPSRWPKSLVESALHRLYPNHLAADRLCSVLAKLDGSASPFDQFGWMLCSAIEDRTATLEYLNALRGGLRALIGEDVHWDRQSHAFVATKQHLTAPLAIVCRKMIESGQRSDEVIQSSVVAIRLKASRYTDTKQAAALRQALAGCTAAIREATFWADDAFCQRHAPETEPRWRLFETRRNGAVCLDAERDAGWVIAALSDRQRSEEQRALMLEAALEGIFDGPDDWNQRAECLRPCVADSPTLRERIAIAKALTQSIIDPDDEEWRRERHAYEREEERKHHEWQDFWTEVARNPEAVFSADRQDNTIWNLWSVMAENGEHSHASGWNRRFMEQNFGRETTERMREALTRAWRPDYPSLRSERPVGEKNSYPEHWALGVAAIAAEAEDPRWARNLSVDEAERAARFALIESSGFPSWLDTLAAAHPDTVAAVLGAELIHELDQPAAIGNFDAMLQHLRRASPNLASLFLPRLRQWLDASVDRMRDGDDIKRVVGRLHAVIEVLLASGNEDLRLQVLNLARTALDGRCGSEFEPIWLPTLMRLHPEDGVAHLEHMLLDAEPQTLGIGATWITRLFDDRHHEPSVNPRGPGFTPVLLLRLVRIAYRHARRSDDVEREASDSSDLRDPVQRGRGALLDALLDRTGADAWAAKLELADDPEHADFRDRLLIRAREKATEEGDGTTLNESDVVALDRYREAPPATRDDMFALLLDRLGDLKDLMLKDDSPRAAWTRIVDEREMRQVIAHELRSAANGAYVVDQEAVTADEKETDIRLRSTTRDLEAVIELKLGEKNRSGRELRETLRNQLVTKYMAPESRRAGCLLITVAKDRLWDHPDTNARLDAVGLQAMLDEEASRIVAEMPGQLRLAVRVLDLRPRLSTEKRRSKELRAETTRHRDE